MRTSLVPHQSGRLQRFSIQKRRTRREKIMSDAAILWNGVFQAACRASEG